MKKLKYLFMGLLMTLLLTACGNGLKKGNYYSVSDEWGKVKLTIEEDDKITIDYLSVNEAIDKEANSSLLGKLFSGAIKDYKITVKGTMDKKKKEFHFTEPEKITEQYSFTNGIIIMSDNNDNKFNQAFYPEDSKELKQQISDFEKNTDGTPNYVKIIFGEAEEKARQESKEEEKNRTAESKGLEESAKETNETDDIKTVADKIKADFLKSLTGHWVGDTFDTLPSAPKGTVDIKEGKRFSAHVTSGDPTYSNGQYELDYNGTFDFSSADSVENALSKLREDNQISDISTLDTYGKFAQAAGEYRSMIELKFTINTKGVIHKEGQDDEAYLDQKNEEMLTRINIWNGHVNFNEILDTSKFLYFAK